MWLEEGFCLYVDGLVQACSNSSASAMELLLSYTKPSILCIPMFLFNWLAPGRCGSDVRFVILDPYLGKIS